MAGKDPAVQAAEFAERERGITEREAALAQREADARKASWASFCDGLVVAGKLTPAQRVHVMTLATQLPPTVQVAEFAEDGTKTGERSAVDVLRALVELLPKQVDFTERAKAGETAIAVDLTSAEAIAAAAVNFQETEAKAGRTVSHTEAVQHVVAQHEGAAQ